MVLGAVDQASLSYDELKNINLMAMRISQPEQDHIKLEMQLSEQTSIGSWIFNPQKKDGGPWMIYSSASSSVSLRPMLWRADSLSNALEIDDNQIVTLHSAVTLVNRDYRTLVIERILSEMCGDFEHSGWEYIRQLSKQNKHLPLTTYNIWSIAVKNAQFLVAIVLQTDESFSQRFGEELPVFWELIPLQDWFAVFSAYKKYLKKIIEDESDVENFINGRINRVGYLSESMVIVAEIIRVQIAGDANQGLGFMKAQPDFARQTTLGVINESKQELLTRHANSSWPEVLKAELITHATKSGSKFQEWLNLNNTQDHQRAVLILPILLAICCADADMPSAWLGDAVIIFKLKCLKDFDSEWFNTNFKVLLAYLSQQVSQ